jgi:hypothetical protein
LPPLMLQCASCSCVFHSGLELSANTYLTMHGNVSQCPRCGSMESLPEGNFKTTVDGILRLVREAPDARKSAEELLAMARLAEASGDVTQLRNSELARWLPDNPQLAVGYIQILIAALQVVLQLLLSNPSGRIEHHEHYNTYNTYISAPASSASEKTTPSHGEKSRKHSRNKKCWCGSGKKYKQCHGSVKR